MKKGWVVPVCVIFSLALVLAQNKIEVSTIKDSYAGGENITFKVSLYDSQNNLINDNVQISLNDSENTVNLESTVPANKLVEADLGANAPFGYWKITANYKDPSTGELVSGSSLFFVELNELVDFELNGDNLTVTNIGNTPYTKTIQILIGDTVGTKTIEDLQPGDKVNLRLLAPDGQYNIKITDGKTTLSQEQVFLTGDAVGILDESLAQGVSGITSGIQKNIMKSSFIYIFLIVIFATAILIAVERRFRKKLGK